MLKKMTIIITLAILGLFFSGCATWDGLKEDSSNAWQTTKNVSSEVYDSTKRSIHKATE